MNRVVEIPYVAEAVTGLLFVVLALGLLRRAIRTDSIAERLLGVVCLLMAASYAFSDAPYAFGLQMLIEPFSLLGRISYAASVIFLAIFTLRVLEGDEPRVRWLVWGSAGLITTGLGLGVLEEDWAGFRPLNSYGFWLEWSGLLVPFVWMGVAAFARFAKVRERARMGLSDPLLSIRFLLLSLFGLFQVLGYFIWAALYIIFESQRQWTTEMDILYAVTDILSILTIWLAYFPPACFRSWIAGAAPDSGASH